MSAVARHAGPQRLMYALSCPRISFRFVPSRFLVPPPVQSAAAPPGCRALPCGPSSRPRWPAIRRSACDPWSGVDRAGARRPGRTAASLSPAAPGPAVPLAAIRHIAACCAAGRSVTDLTCRAQWARDDAGPGRQASPSCPPARARAGHRTGSSAAPPATARDARSPARTVTDGRAATACPCRGLAGRRLA
jgi:hypothetical protein